MSKYDKDLTIIFRCLVFKDRSFFARAKNKNPVSARPTLKPGMGRQALHYTDTQMSVKFFLKYFIYSENAGIVGINNRPKYIPFSADVKSIRTV
jgi:hypothetical protein